jgi:C4-type Zn-finger protein
MAQSTKLRCSVCGAEMNHHAEKVEYDIDDATNIDPVFGGVLMEAHCCPNCGHTELRAA